jgi:hypothetical protein
MCKALPERESARIAVPEALDWDTVKKAVAAIEEWELHADGLATELAIELFCIFNRGRS